ncbi:MAG: hypothetical protein GY928_25075 [Colwellia sp.]|nr:hypothetical protein [Colwellia sp.]
MNKEDLITELEDMKERQLLSSDIELLTSAIFFIEQCDEANKETRELAAETLYKLYS